MEARVLGPLQVSGPGDNRTNLASRPQRRLMSLLVMRANTVVPADMLEDHLNLSPGALRTSVSRLRKLIGSDVLITAPPGYELRTHRIDALRFERLLARARAGDDDTARAALLEALDLWRGGAYAEFAHEEWAMAEVARLTELQVSAVEELADLLVGAGAHAEAIARLEPVIDVHRFRDRLRAALMRALAQSGRRTEALRQFQAYRSLLVEEVGTEPSPLLVALDRAIAVRAEGDLDALPAPEHLRPGRDQARQQHSSARGARPAGRSRGVFLFTDVVGSTRLWAQHPDAMADDLAQHDHLVSTAIITHGGSSFSTAGDSFAAVFDDVDDAVAGAVAAQTALADAMWRIEDGISVRIAVHLGEAERRGDGWYGPPLNETARIMAAGHGGQILVSEPVAAAMTGRRLIDLGEHHLRDLEGSRRLFQVTDPTLRAEFPPLRSMGGYLTTLPAQRTSFLGRRDLLARIHDLVLRYPLVTLLGPGGTGKTRVAIEAAGRELPHFRDGVFFVDLTKAAFDAEVVTAMLSGLDLSVPPDQTPEEALTDHLADRGVLLVVDNCEHVIERTAALISDLLRAAPGLRVLATSREPLGLDGEQCQPVPALDADGPTSTAVRLFTERALAADPSVELDNQALATVDQITRRLDGMPLAIELAAARVRSLSPGQILGHLDERFRLLRNDHRRVPPRQQTLEATIDWSYDLLDRDERRNFRCLAICAGPFSLSIVGGLLGLDELGSAGCLESLVSKSLVTPLRVGGSSQGYYLLESLRAYGLAKLDEADELAAARTALERALLPPPAHADDWTWLVNEYMTDGAEAGLLEDTTRREAARYALDAGRLDAAALLYCSCAFRDDPGNLVTVLRMVSPVAGRKTELGGMAWRAANAAKVSLERLTRRYADCLGTASEMLADLDADDPARPWFEMWRCALTIAVAPEIGLAEVDDLITRAIHHARPPHDFTVSQLLTSKVTGLALVRRLDEARATASLALDWTQPGTVGHDQALASLLWLLVFTGEAPDPRVRGALTDRHQERGMAQFCAAPATVCARTSSDARAAELVRLARRRPLGDVATPYLLAFACLALERGDPDRAAELAAVAELYDSSTEIALIHLLARLGHWTDDDWKTQRDAAIAHYLSPAHEPVAEQGSCALDAEVSRWATPAEARA